MKKIGKILSSFLAVSVVLSCISVNVFADSAKHTLTLAASKTENLVKGEDITVTVTLDSTANLDTVEYRIVFDTDVFELDTTKTLPIRPESYIDSTWWGNVTNNMSNWGAYMTQRMYSPTNTAAGVDGELYMAFGSPMGGIDASLNEDNFVVGNFKFKVKADAPDTNTTLYLKSDSNTKDGNEVLATEANVGNPISITVGEPAPEKEPASITAPTGDLPKTKDYTYTTADGEFYNTGFDVNFKVTDGNFDVDGVQIDGTVTGDPQNRTEFSKKVELKTGIVAPEAGKEAVNVRFALNIKDVPSAVAIALTKLTPYAN